MVVVLPQRFRQPLRTQFHHFPTLRTNNIKVHRISAFQSRLGTTNLIRLLHPLLPHIPRHAQRQSGNLRPFTRRGCQCHVPLCYQIVVLRYLLENIQTQKSQVSNRSCDSSFNLSAPAVLTV